MSRQMATCDKNVLASRRLLRTVGVLCCTRSLCSARRACPIPRLSTGLPHCLCERRRIPTAPFQSSDRGTPSGSAQRDSELQPERERHERTEMDGGSDGGRRREAEGAILGHRRRDRQRAPRDGEHVRGGDGGERLPRSAPLDRRERRVAERTVSSGYDSSVVVPSSCSTRSASPWTAANRTPKASIVWIPLSSLPTPNFS